MPTDIQKVIKQGIKLLYLDDEMSDLTNFRRRFSNYDGDLNHVYNFEVVTLSNVSEVIKYFKNNEVPIFLCDHNMEERKGIELIDKFLRTEYPKTTYIIFSGALNQNVTKELLRVKIKSINKSSDTDTLLNKIMMEYRLNNTIQEFPLREGDDFYDMVANDMIADLKFIKEPDSFRYYTDGKELKIHEYYHQLKDKTDLGIQFVKNFYTALKFFNTKL